MSTIEAIIANRIVPPPIPVIPEMIEVNKAEIARIISDVSDSAIFLSTTIIDYKKAIHFLYISTSVSFQKMLIPESFL